MRFCKKCGTQIPDGAMFCPNCGTASQPVAAPVQPAAAPVQPAAAPVQPTAPVRPAPAAPVYTPPQATVRPPETHTTVNVVNNTASADMAPVMSTGRYIGMFFLLAIPVVSFILTIVWACGGCSNPNQRNYAKAMLILELIAVGLGVIVCVILLLTGISLGSLI